MSQVRRVKHAESGPCVEEEEEEEEEEKQTGCVCKECSCGARCTCVAKGLSNGELTITIATRVKSRLCSPEVKR